MPAKLLGSKKRRIFSPESFVKPWPACKKDIPCPQWPCMLKKWNIALKTERGKYK
jgi:hypothetical protein